MKKQMLNNMTGFEYLHNDQRTEPERRLAHAIVYVAVDDYIEALKQNKTKKIAELEEFFRSKYCKFLCNIDAEVIISLAKSCC